MSETIPEAIQQPFNNREIEGMVEALRTIKYFGDTYSVDVGMGCLSIVYDTYMPTYGKDRFYQLKEIAAQKLAEEQAGLEKLLEGCHE